jgi:hypothetical protein
MSTMSVDRYCTIRYPIGYGRNRTKTTVALKIAFVWIISIAICSGLAVSGFLDYSNVYSDGQCVPAIKDFVLYGSLMAFYVPLVIMIVTYALTVRILADNRRTMKELGMKTINPHQLHHQQQVIGTMVEKDTIDGVSVGIGDGNLTTLRLPTDRNSMQSSALTLPGISEASGDANGQQPLVSLCPFVHHHSRLLDPCHQRQPSVGLMQSLLSMSPILLGGMACHRERMVTTFEDGTAVCGRNPDVERQTSLGMRRQDDWKRQDYEDSYEITVTGNRTQLPASCVTQSTLIPDDSQSFKDNDVEIVTALNCSQPQQQQSNSTRETTFKHCELTATPPGDVCYATEALSLLPEETVQYQQDVPRFNGIVTTSSAETVVGNHRLFEKSGSECYEDGLNDSKNYNKNSTLIVPPERTYLPEREKSNRGPSPTCQSDDDIDFDVEFEMSMMVQQPPRAMTDRLRIQRPISGDGIQCSRQISTSDCQCIDADCVNKSDANSLSVVERNTCFGTRNTNLLLVPMNEHSSKLSSSSLSMATESSDDRSNAKDLGTSPTSASVTSYDVTRRSMTRPSRQWKPLHNRLLHISQRLKNSPLAAQGSEPKNMDRTMTKACNGSDVSTRFNGFQPTAQTPAFDVQRRAKFSIDELAPMRLRSVTTGTSDATPSRGGEIRGDLPSIVLSHSVSEAAASNKSSPDRCLHLPSSQSAAPSSSLVFTMRQRCNSAVTNNSSSGERTWSLTIGGATSTSAEGTISAATMLKRHRSTANNERKASKVLGIIFGVFIVLWSPFFRRQRSVSPVRRQLPHPRGARTDVHVMGGLVGLRLLAGESIHLHGVQYQIQDSVPSHRHLPGGLLCIVLPQQQLPVPPLREVNARSSAPGIVYVYRSSGNGLPRRRSKRRLQLRRRSSAPKCNRGKYRRHHRQTSTSNGLVEQRYLFCFRFVLR